MSEGWARVRNVYQCCDFTVIFWGGTLGDGGGGGGYKDLDYTQTIFLAIAGSTHYSISYLNRRL